MTRRALDRAFLEKQPVVFYPKTQAEALAMQQALFRLGCVWLGGGGSYPWKTETCLRKGIHVDTGLRLHFGGDGAKELELTLQDLVEGMDVGGLMKERDRLQEYFTQIAQRQEIIEAKLDRILELLEADKVARLPKPKGHDHP